MPRRCSICCLTLIRWGRGTVQYWLGQEVVGFGSTAIVDNSLVEPTLRPHPAQTAALSAIGDQASTPYLGRHRSYITPPCKRHAAHRAKPGNVLIWEGLNSAFPGSCSLLDMATSSAPRSQQTATTKKGRLLDEDEGGGTVASSVLLLGEGGSGAAEPPPPPMVYSIRNGDNRIGNFILHKAEFCAGDIVLGNFDFSEASTRCLQVRGASWGRFIFLEQNAGLGSVRRGGGGVEEARFGASPILRWAIGKSVPFATPERKKMFRLSACSRRKSPRWSSRSFAIPDGELRSLYPRRSRITAGVHLRDRCLSAE